MERMEPPKEVPNLCEWCGGAGTSRCGRCHIAYYCSREHQMLHWSAHKKVCKKSLPPVVTVTNLNQLRDPAFPSTSNWDPGNVQVMAVSSSDNNNAPPVPRNANNPNAYKIPSNMNIPSEDEIMSSFGSEMLTSDNNFWSMIDTCAAQNFSELDQYLGKPSGDGQASKVSQHRTPGPVVKRPNVSPPPTVKSTGLMECQPLRNICYSVVHDLNNFGICCLDNFLGEKAGDEILQEVLDLYEAGVFKRGQIINPYPDMPEESARTDVMTWVDGTEPDCRNIAALIKKLDVVVSTCNKMQDNGQLSKYKLHKRTKAMVACYPGNGTHYKTHVDNPYKDGRCITCIYYLNKDWIRARDGGTLRMYPMNRKSGIAEIDPIFDRMIFFWSDRRNPHEVCPAFKTRFAITVWYFDADEREAALKAKALKQAQSQKASS